MTSIGVQDLAFLKVFSWNQRVHDLFVHCWKVCRCLAVMAPATQARPARNRRNRSTKSRAVGNQNGADHDLNGNPRRDLRVDFLWYVCKRRGVGVGKASVFENRYKQSPTYGYVSVLKSVRKSNLYVCRNSWSWFVFNVSHKVNSAPF